MVRSVIAFLNFLLVAALLAACNQSPTGIRYDEELDITLQVSGGFAGAEFTVLLDGSSAVLRGISCVNLCDFQAGEVIQTLTVDQVRYIRDLFRAAQVHALDGQDYGVQCCDQFHYDLQFRDTGGSSTVRGSSEALPVSLRAAIGTLHGLASGTVPLITDLSSTRGPWVGDPYQILEASIQGDVLYVGIGYGGGCRAHAVRAVAWGGWMESNPVQVRVIISHEDFDDPCDAFVTQDLRFDLGPLKNAYQETFGTAPAGETTLVVLLEDPLIAGPLGARWLEYLF